MLNADNHHQNADNHTQKDNRSLYAIPAIEEAPYVM